MEILNRSAITVLPKQASMDWANGLILEFPMEINVLGEPHTYLTNPDFENAQKHIKKYFKEIFIEELNGIWTDETIGLKKEISRHFVNGLVSKFLIGFKI